MSAFQVEYFTRTSLRNTRVPFSVTPGNPSRCTSRKRGSPARKIRPASVTPLAFVQFDLFQGRHATEDFQAAIGDLCQPGVIVVQRQACDVLRGKVGCVTAIHARQALQARAGADVTEAVIFHVDGREFAQCRKVRQGRKSLIVHILAANTDSAQGRHFGEGHKPPAAEVGTNAPPEEFERPRLA